MTHAHPLLVRARRSDLAITVPLLALAAVGWWWSARMAAQMSAPMVSGPMVSAPMTSGTPVGTSMGAAMPMSLSAFVIGWIAMMAAMMFPAVVPVVRLYARASRAGTVASAPVFVTGYLLVWGAAGIPVWWAWQALAGPVAAGNRTAAMAAGVALVAAGVYQLSPAKASCLRQCRSPMGFFLQLRGDLRSPQVALRAGVSHGLLCLGCCWALMAVLVAVGTMHLAWMLGLTALVFVEKVLGHGDLIGRMAGLALIPAGAVLLAHPSLITAVT